MPEIGQTISHYKIQQKIGEGGMGVVFLAYDTSLDRKVAIKFLPKEFQKDETAAKRFSREARSAAALDHPYICNIHEVGEAEGESFIVMEYVEGQTIKDKLAAGPLPMKEALQIATEVTEALEKAHKRGIIHRDVKPSNIMLTPEGHAKVMDFGLAKHHLSDQGLSQEDTLTALTRERATVGTLAYMSPEQVRGQDVDTRSDIFSFGVLFYEILTGTHPFKKESDIDTASAILNVTPPELSRKIRDVTEAFDSIIGKMLAKSPGDRHRSFSEVRASMKELSSKLAEPRIVGVLSLFRSLKMLKVSIPAVLALLLASIFSIWLYKHSADLRWARDTALPRIERLAEEENFQQAYELARQVKQYVPDDPQLASLWPRFSQDVSIRTDPSGASVYFKEYSMPESDWELLGTTPIEAMRLRRVLFRWKIEKDGYESMEAMSLGTFDHLTDEAGVIHLEAEGSAPLGMIRIPGGEAGGIRLADFWIDKYEVTNKEFKEFVNQGGYQKKEYWKHEFLRDGADLSWEEAMALFKDSTGRPGPATWEAGDYPEGRNDFPVNGISWYEAAAYAEFIGKSLPTVYHWQLASGLNINTSNVSSAPTATFISYRTSVMSMSNFAEVGPAPVGKYQGINHFGVYDMAGNVREWCWNVSQGGRFIRGGAWNDINYMYSNWSQQTPFNRSPKNGFRCVIYLDLESIPESAFQQEQWLAYRNYTNEQPVTDDVFQVYKSQFLYDPIDLSPEVEWQKEDSADWTEEKVTYHAGYGQERMIAHLFLPKMRKPPYQTVIFFPGSGVINSQREEPNQVRVIDFVIKNGRAVLYPIYKGTHARRVGPLPPADSHEFKDYVVMWVKEFKRSVDFLETRPEIDSSRLAFYGFSWGGMMGFIVSAVEPRLKANIFYLGGLTRGQCRPEIDGINFVSRVTIPTLMLNGRFDITFPLEINVEPAFKLLGTPDQDKHIVLYDTDHFIPKKERIKESLAWLDQYLGPVN